MLKNDTLKNGTSRIGLYGSAPPGLCDHPVSDNGSLKPELILHLTLKTQSGSEELYEAPNIL